MCLAPLALVLATLPAAQQPVKPPAPAAVLSPDEQALKSAYLAATGPALLDFFRKRTPPGPDDERIAELIKGLNDNSATARDQACGELVSLGVAAVPRLREAANHLDDPETSSRAHKCLQSIEGAPGAAVVTSAARLLAAQKPAGAAEALLGYLPFADDDRVLKAVEAALDAVALRDGKPEPALLRALEDRVSIRRAVAAEVVSRVGGSAYYGAVRPLLKDPKPTVRLRAALGLVNGHDGDAVPVLIDLLADLPPEPRKHAEEYLTQLAGEWAVSGPVGQDALSRRLRRELWLTWWRATDGPLLREEFRSRTPSDDEREQALALIQKLDGSSAEVREKAAADLVALGPRIAPLLRQSSHNPNPRIGPFAAKCLQLIEKDGITPLPGAAPRLLALRRPEGTLETLLAYLPYADTESSANQVRELLSSLGFRDGKPEPALVRALEDRVGARRWAAAVVLCKVAPGEHLPAVRKLLGDPDAEVRLRAGLALAGLREKDAVPVLIAVLPELSLDQAWEVEDYLGRLAGDKGPAVFFTADPAARQKCRDAWSAWWKENGATVDLARVEQAPRQMGFTLVVEQFDQARRSGRVLELDAAGKVRWQFDGLLIAQDAQVLPGERVLVLEQSQQNRVTERDFKGKILWEKPVGNALSCQRLRNGNTFIVCRNLLLEVDPSGKDVFSYPRNDLTILAAEKFRDGQIAFFSYQGLYVRLDSAGKEVRSYRIPLPPNGFSGAHVLPGDRLVVTMINANKVVEYDADGKQVWEATVQAPSFPQRLPNGNTLVPSYAVQRITELDRTGRIVSEMKDVGFRPWRVSRR
jgi:HEAT repeat protein